MAKHPWLTLRRNRWYLRAKVPVDLVAVLGKAEIKRSLRTSDRREANEQIDGEAAKVREVFAAARRKLCPIESLSDREIEHVAMAWFRNVERVRVQSWYAEQQDDDFDLAVMTRSWQRRSEQTGHGLP